MIKTGLPSHLLHWNNSFASTLASACNLQNSGKVQLPLNILLHPVSVSHVITKIQSSCSVNPAELEFGTLRSSNSCFVFAGLLSEPDLDQGKFI